MKNSQPTRSIALKPALAREFPLRVLEWYDANQRDLPWRRTNDPYAILVSEFMLQQTQVSTVEPYYGRFLAEFPTVESLAAAAEQDVLRQWAGLGYYSRARNLHASARRIVEQYGGRVPSQYADLLFLPGVGSYVAAAVSSIAFGETVGAVDANVARVLCRVLALSENPASPAGRRALETLSNRLISRERPGDFNQAMMELGALVCSAGKARCDACPLATFCKARIEGNPLAYPPAAKRVAMVEVEEARAVLKRERERGEPDEYYMVRCSGRSGRYRNMWEFPGLEVSGAADPRQALGAFLYSEHDLAVTVGEEWAEIRHQVTHHKIRKRVFLCEIAPSRKRKSPASIEENGEEIARWASTEEIAHLPLGAPHKRILALLTESVDLFQL